MAGKRRSQAKRRKTRGADSRKTARQGIRKIDPDADLATLFAETRAKPQKFSEALREHLASADLAAAISEKKKSGGTGPKSVQALIKNHPPPQDEVDLHGRTAEEAEQQCSFFLERARHFRLRTVRIITGKGLHSPQGAVLPDVVETKLVELKNQQAILAFRWDKKEKRKSGSVLVYL